MARHFLIPFYALGNQARPPQEDQNKESFFQPKNKGRFAMLQIERMNLMPILVVQVLFSARVQGDSSKSGSGKYSPLLMFCLSPQIDLWKIFEIKNKNTYTNPILFISYHSHLCCFSSLRQNDYDSKMWQFLTKSLE